MIRLTVEQLNALRDSIQAGGQVHCAVLPLVATYAQNLVIAWAKGRAEGEEYYLSIWRDTKSLDKARQEEEEGKHPPYDFVNDPHSMDYSHTYPAERAVHLVNAIRLGKDGSPIGIIRLGSDDWQAVSSADSSYPESGVLLGKD